MNVKLSSVMLYLINKGLCNKRKRVKIMVAKLYLFDMCKAFHLIAKIIYNLPSL